MGQQAGLGVVEPAGSVQDSGDALDVQHPMQPIASLLQPLAGAAIAGAAMVDENHHILYLETRTLELGDPFQHTAARNQHIVHHHHQITLFKITLNQPARTMGLDLLAGVDERFVEQEGKAGGGG
jgi:hypothetical protein